MAATNRQILHLLSKEKAIKRHRAYSAGFLVANTLTKLYRNYYSYLYDANFPFAEATQRLFFITSGFVFISQVFPHYCFPDIYEHGLTYKKANDHINMADRIDLIKYGVVIQVIEALFTSYVGLRLSKETAAMYIAISTLILGGLAYCYEWLRIKKNDVMLEKLHIDNAAKLEDSLWSVKIFDRESLSNEPVAKFCAITFSYHCLVIQFDYQTFSKARLCRTLQEDRKGRTEIGNIIINQLALHLMDKFSSAQFLYEKSQLIVRMKPGSTMKESLELDQFVTKLDKILRTTILLQKIAESLQIKHIQFSFRQNNFLLFIPKKIVDFSKEFLQKLEENNFFIRENGNIVIDATDMTRVELLQNLLDTHTKKRLQNRTTAFQQAEDKEEPLVICDTPSLFVDTELENKKIAKRKTRRRWGDLSSFLNQHDLNGKSTIADTTTARDCGRYGVYDPVGNSNGNENFQLIELQDNVFAAIPRSFENDLINAPIEQLSLAHRRRGKGSHGIILTLTPEEALDGQPVFAKIKAGADKSLVATIAQRYQHADQTIITIVEFTRFLPHGRTNAWPAHKVPEIPIHYLRTSFAFT